MSHRDLDRLFALFCRDGDLEALAAVFLIAAPALLRRARRRLGDAAAAEDIVQDLFLSLLQGGARYDGARSSLPFLFGALHRHLDKWQRRRRWCDALPVAVLDGRSDPAHESVQKEQRQRIRAAIAELPSTCRDVVADYLEREHTPAEIARRTGQRGSTVRVQIHRGLARLRQLLPGVPLLALFATPSAAQGAPPAAEATRPIARRLLLPAAAAAALAVLATSSAAAPDEPQRATAGAQIAASPVAEPRANTDEGARERLAQPAARHALQVRVVDAAGAPVPAVGVRVWRAGSDADFAAAAGATDAGGVFACAELERGEWTVGIDRDQRADVAVAGECTEQRFVVAGGVTVHGVVRDAAGAPVAGAGIWVCELPRHPWDGQVVAQADEAGRFELRHVPALSAVAATAPGRVPSPVQAVGPLPQRSMELRLGGAAAELHGIVVGPDGPVASAVVHVGRKPRAGYSLPNGEQFACLYPGLRSCTGADGTFTVPGLPPGSLEVLVRVDGHSDAIVPVRAVAGQRFDVRVAMSAGLSLRGTVRMASGAPLAAALVSARGVSPRHWSAAHTRGDGSFALTGLDPRRIEVLVECDDHAPSRFVVTDSQRALEVALAPVSRTGGVLVDTAHKLVDRDQFDFGVRGGTPGISEPWPLPLDEKARFSVPDDLGQQFFARRRGEAVWQACSCVIDLNSMDAPLYVSLPPDFDERATIRLQRHGFTTAELLDAVLFLQRGDDVYHITPDQPAESLWVLPPLPKGPWQLHLFGRTGLCPAVAIGNVELPAAGIDVEATAPPRGFLRWEIGVQDRTAVEQFRAFLSDDQGRQVPLQRPAGRIAVPAGKWRLWASSLDFAVVRGHPVEVRAGEETALELLQPRAHVRQLAFWLPRGVDAAAAKVQLCRDGVPVLGSAAEQPACADDSPRAQGLQDNGFDCGPDGFCSIVMALGDGHYRLALASDSGTFATEFDVAGPGSDAVPVVLALAPVQ